MTKVTLNATAVTQAMCWRNTETREKALNTGKVLNVRPLARVLQLVP